MSNQNKITLQSDIDTKIYENSTQDITGANLNEVLTSLNDSKVSKLDDIDIDPLFTANSDLLVPSQKAVNTALALINTNAVDRLTVKLGEAINKGQAVYISSANGSNIVVSKASNSSEGTSSKTLGLLETTGTTNAILNVITSGLLTGLNTNTATIGDPVWLSTSGNLLFGLANKPVAPSHLVYIGVVTRVSATVGEILIKVQNGFEIDELHNVLISSLVNNDLLQYDSSTSLWKNKQVTTADIADSTNKRYVTDANLTTIGNQSGINTGDETSSTIKTKLGIITLSGSNTGDQTYLDARVQSVTSSATVTPLSTNDLVKITAQEVGLTLANPTGIFSEGQALMIRIKDNATAQTIAFGTNYRAIGITLPTTTVISKTMYLGIIYNSTDTKWDIVGYNIQA